MKKILILLVLIQQTLFAQDVLLHSHNDYLQKHPLKTALENKANTIEVDVAWHNEKIKVTHIVFLMQTKPLLEELYLKKMLAQKDDLVSVKFLMIDIKSGSEEILVALNQMISEYQEIFASRSETESKKIRVVISGGAHRENLVKNNKLNYLFADGNPGDLDANLDSWLMPFVSTNYTSKTEEERISIIEKAHAQGKLVRFWNTSDNVKTWKKLLNLNVDIIGVDNLKRFRFFIN